MEMTQVNPNAQEQEDVIDFKELLSLLLNHRWPI